MNQPDCVYAGFWRRLLAGMIDITIVFLIWLPIVRSDPDNSTFTGFLVVAFPLMCVLYYSILEGVSGTTPGKLTAGVRVVNRTGGRLGIGRALARSLAKLLSLATLGVGFAISGATKRRRALHDMLAGTLVVSRAPVDDAALAAGLTMRLSAAVPLGVLLVVVLIAAIPSVIDYLTDDPTPQRYVEPPIALSLEELGHGGPASPHRDVGIDLDRLSVGVTGATTRQIVPSAPGPGGSLTR